MRGACGLQPLLDQLLVARGEPEAALALGEVDPREAGVELGAEELGGRRVARRMLGEETVDGLGDALGVGSGGAGSGRIGEVGHGGNLT